MSSFEGFVARFHDHATRDANVCVAKGVDKHLDDLPDPGLSAIRAHAAEARALLGEVHDLRKDASLPFEDRLDLDLAELSLSAEEHNASYRFNGRTTAEQMPTAGSDIGTGIFLLFANDPRPAAERLSDIERRLARVPEYLDALLERLEVPIARWVRMDMEKVKGLPSLFSTVEAFAESESWEGRARLSSTLERARAACDAYVARLARLPTESAIFVGVDTAARIVQLRGIEQSLSDLSAWSRDFLRSTQQYIDELRGRLAAKYGLSPGATAEEVHVHLNRRFRLEVGGEFGRVLTRYESELQRILEFIRAHELFPILDDQELLVLETPEFMQPSIPAGAMMSPPPFRGGTSRSLVYLTLSEALLDEHTEITIPNMMIHEGIPGHHLHLATAGRHASIIRRHIEAMDQAEGWTTMLEDYMLDAGYAAELSDEVRFLAKRDICRLAARVAIDLFFMTGDRAYLDIGADCDIEESDTFEVAGELLASVTGFVPERVEAELNWYSQERGYPLSYLTGNHLVWQLKRDVERHTGLSGLQLDRTFHSAYLCAGVMPVSFLRRKFAHDGLIA